MKEIARCEYAIREDKLKKVGERRLIAATKLIKLNIKRKTE